MKLFSKKISSLFLVFAYTLTFVLSTFSPFLSIPRAKAQCQDAPGETYCTNPITGAQAACNVDAIRGFWGDPDLQDTRDFCEAILYEINRSLFATPPPSFWYDPPLITFGRKVFDDTNPDEIFGERYTYAQVNWILNSLVISLFPPLATSNLIQLFDFIFLIIEGIERMQTTLLSDSSIIIDSLPKLGMIGGTYYLMAQIPKFIFISPIASGVEEVKYVASKFNLATPVLAQGLGYQKLGLGSVRGLWIATRNMAYLVATIILVIAGLMVIFRTKISPQASVTVQMIIPRLIISLTLVTFSYAIAGFVIDMMYVIITAALGLIYFSQTVLSFDIIDNLGLAIETFTGDFNFVSYFLGAYIVAAIFLLVVSIGIALVAIIAPGAAIVVPLLGIILGFVVWSIYVWARILGQLVVAYITLMLLVIAGPIMIIMDILPTSTGGFKKWFLCLVGNASVFVGYAFMSMLTIMLFATNWNIFSLTTPTGFTTIVGSSHINTTMNLPLFNGGYPFGGINIFQYLLQYFIFIGFISIVPNIVQSIKNIFCKTTDFSNFLENTVKDTIGQFSKAGQEAGKAGERYMDKRQQQGKPPPAAATTTQNPAGTTVNP